MASSIGAREGVHSAKPVLRQGAADAEAGAAAGAAGGGGDGDGGERISPQQRGRKRAASYDAADPATRESQGAGGAAVTAWTGGGDGGGGDGGGVGTATTAMDVETASPVQGRHRVVSEGGGGGEGGAGVGDEPSSGARAGPAEQSGAAEQSGDNGGPAGAGLAPIEEISIAGVVADSEAAAAEAAAASEARGGGTSAAPQELPLLELEKQSTVDTLFELMESGQSVSVLVWDLLMKMPTNMELCNGFS